MDSKDMTLAPTPQSIVGLNELNNSPMEPNLTQYFQSTIYKHLWNWQQLQTLLGEVNKFL
jgi:hypothetical protein